MRNKKMNYGSIVGLDPVIYADTCVFIPHFFSWEKEHYPAEIVMGDYKIRCNLGTRLLFKTDKGVVDKVLPFEKKDDEYILNLVEFFDQNHIAYSLGDGIYCGGVKYNQKDSTEEVIYDKNVIIGKNSSPHWGLQMEMSIVNKKLRPKVRGMKVENIRFNYCRKEKQYSIEKWFINVVNGTTPIEPYTLDKVMRENLEKNILTSCSLLCKADNKYHWENYY